MTIIQSLWNSIENQYNNGTFPSEQLEKIDELVFSDDIENIRNGLTLITTISPEYLCRYLKLDGESVVLQDLGVYFKGDPTDCNGEYSTESISIGSGRSSAELVSGNWRTGSKMYRFSTLNVERELLKSTKRESMWQDLYESGAFDRMEHNIFATSSFAEALGSVTIENLSETEKAFCVQMAKKMVRVPAGEFMMGALDDDNEALDSEKPRHKVTLTRDFLIGKYLVTQVLWESVMGSNPSWSKGPNRPVEQVSWYDVLEFCNKLSELEGLEPVYTINNDDVTCNWNSTGYRLPTEAEWEYSARGGQYFKYSGSDNADEVAWYWANSSVVDVDDYEGEVTHPVGHRKPNDFGLYDMSGNVEEWVWDWWEMWPGWSWPEDYSAENPQDSLENPTGDPNGAYRVVRGGSFGCDLEGVRLSGRSHVTPKPSDYIGFRICRFT